MMGLKALAATVLGVALLAGAAPASAGAAAYKHYVGCGVSEHATPARSCSKSEQKGRLLREPRRQRLLLRLRQVPERETSLQAQKQEATKGTLYVNKITSDIPGKHKVTWFVSGKRVGSYSFTVGK